MVAATLGAVFLHETLTAQSLAGMGLILLGIFAASIKTMPKIACKRLRHTVQ